ncbi:hypothetical protein OAD50_04290 [Vicingaceae bacterium]|nr:hypothetical protein [Vicingaceae bacterium]
MESYKRFNTTTVVIFGIFSSITLYGLSFEPYGPFPKFLAIISSFIVFFLVWEAVLNKNIEISYILPFIAMNWLYFQSPLLLQGKTQYYNRIIKDEYIDEIAIYCCLSIFLIYAGYKFFFNRKYKLIEGQNLKFKDDVLIKVIYLFIFLGILFRLGKEFTPQYISSLSNLIQILPYCSSIAFGLYVLKYLRNGKNKRFSKFDIIIIIFLVSEFLIRLSTTLFSEVIILFAGPLIVFLRERSKLPIVSIVISLLVLVPFYQTRKYFRLHSEVVKDFQGGELSKGRFLLQNTYTVDKEDEFKILQEQGKDFNRFENLSFISHVVLQHKKGIKPFLYGETFYWLPLVPIPRILYPSKPRNIMSTEVSTAYGLRGIVSIASINFPMLVESYINFDFKGMLFMAFLFGLSYKWFAMKFGFGLGDVNLIIIINSIKQFAHAEGNITLVFGALIQVYLFWSVLILVLNLKPNNLKLFDK